MRDDAAAAMAVTMVGCLGCGMVVLRLAFLLGMFAGVCFIAKWIFF